MNDYTKRLGNKEKLRRLLSDGAVHHMRELHAVAGWRFGGRIYELRKEGYDIETIFIGADETAYQMHVEGQRRMAI